LTSSLLQAAKGRQTLRALYNHKKSTRQLGSVGHFGGLSSQGRFPRRVRGFLLCFFATISLFACSQKDTLRLYYFNNAPFTSCTSAEPIGIEIEIITEYVAWLKNNKLGADYALTFQFVADYQDLFLQIKGADKNSMALGGNIYNAEKAREVDYSVGFLKNVAFCVTNGNAPDIKSKTASEIVRTLGSMKALTIPNSNLDKYVKELKKLYINDLKIIHHSAQTSILEDISRNVLCFGYVEAIEFWFYLKNNPQKFLKPQKLLSQSKEEIAFVLPKGSPHLAWFNEFFAGSKGFKNFPAYREILEKHLGIYMTQNMSIHPSPNGRP
jgi:hypothetical protein